jgi:hypothetical protein
MTHRAEPAFRQIAHSRGKKLRTGNSAYCETVKVKS